MQFSSTAVLLRHEREAHGMHGHGDRPHLCLYPGCERSIPGNGFPRRYNLFDHMRRVHDHQEDKLTISGTENAQEAAPAPARDYNVGYICVECLDREDLAGLKWWPRKDNFKSHVRRRHPDANLEVVIQA